MWLQTMKTNNFIILILALLVVKDLTLKLLILPFAVFYLFKKKINGCSYKEITNNLVYLICVIVVNYLLNVNLDALNFLYFVLLNWILFLSKKNIKMEKYMSIYLLLVVICGGVKLCVSF